MERIAIIKNINAKGKCPNSKNSKDERSLKTKVCQKRNLITRNTYEERKFINLLELVKFERKINY